MINLEKEFISGVGGYSQAPGPLKYVQLDRTNGLPNNFAVYRRFYADGKPKDLEVFRIKIVPKGTQKFPGGATREILDDTERYAHTSEFGFTAWSFENEGAARWKFNQLATGNVITDIGMEASSEPATAEVADSANDIAPEAPKQSGRGRPKAAPVELVIPDSDFSVKELATQNNVQYVIAYQFVKANEGTKIVQKREERRAARGPMTAIYGKTS